MKRRCITAVVALIAGAITACAVNPAVSGGLTLVFDNPDFECRKSAVATVKRIERCDTATRLDFHAEYRPHFWIKLDSTACLSDPLTGNKYQVLGTEGIEFNKEYWMPDWDDLLQYTLDRICDRPYRLRKTCFGGELGDINRELAEAPQPPVQWVGYIYKTMTPTEATRQIEDWDSKYKAALDRYAADTPLHPHSRKLLDVNRRMLKTYMMLDYAMYRADVEREDSPAPSLAEPLTADYFAFLKGPMADSDPWLAANRNATIISNRIGFCKLFDLCGVDRLVDSKAESMLMKDLAGTDDIPFLWQIALSSQLCSASSIKPGSYTREEAFDLVEAVIGSGAVTDPYIIDVMRGYFTGLYGRQDYGLPDDERGRVVSEIIAPYRGKYILLDFWSTGCGPCRSNIEHSAALRKANREHPDFKMIFITSDDESPQGAYDKYVAANLEGETSHRIPAADFNRLRDLFRFNGIPRYILIDREGKVIDDRFSYHNLHNAFGKLGVALNEAPTEE